VTTRTYRESGAGPEESASAVDPLLGPAAIADLARRELERAERYRRVLSLAVIELPEGDAREAALVRRLSATLRGPDAVGRLDAGGLLILLPETPRGGAEACIRRLRRLTESDVGDLQIGIASFPQDGQRWDELVRVALGRMGTIEVPPVPNASLRGSLRGAFPSFYRPVSR
jgi:GGDEF domain-containing protein